METILVVDDEPVILSVVDKALRTTYRVRAATSGAAALRAVKVEPTPDAVLLDVLMPDMSGFEVLQRMKEDPDVREIPVLFLTSLSDRGSERTGLQIGAVDFIRKPIDPEVLLARLSTQLVAKKARDWLRDENRVLDSEVAKRMRENDLTQTVAIRALAHLAETRDTDTGDHIMRTQAFVRILALRLRHHPAFADALGATTIDLLVKSAPLHDIGKVGIPDAILRKPGPLTAEERQVMETHSVIGFDAIERAEQDVDQAVPFLQYAKAIVRSHHEKWDGSGYPDGLAGEEIPVPARLMALADAYDAITSKRVYKGAQSHHDARDIIVGDSGSHFDPDVVEAFVAEASTFERTNTEMRDAGAPVRTDSTHASPTSRATRGAS